MQLNIRIKMKKLVQISALTAAIVMSCSGAALAHGTETHTHEKPAESTQQTVKNRTQAAEDKVAAAETLREEKRAATTDAKQAALERKKEKRQNICQSRKQGLENKFARIVTNSERFQTRIDSILDKAVEYQQTNNVEAGNFDELVTAAETAQSTSSDSIAKLKAFQPSIDCNSETVSSDVQSFKAAAATVRDDLKAYKQAVKNVLKALIDAKNTETETEGGEQ
jgi:hypothetical protein